MAMNKGKMKNFQSLKQNKQGQKMKIKTIDIDVLEWFDKVNGNSYFAGIVTLNYGIKSEKVITMPFQYGYGEHYIDIAGKLLQERGYIKPEKYFVLWRYCKDNNIILRTYKRENCKKSELLQF